MASDQDVGFERKRDEKADIQPYPSRRKWADVRVSTLGETPKYETTIETSHGPQRTLNY
jgi:hypothetical protein